MPTPERSRYKISPGQFVSGHSLASAVPTILTLRRQNGARGRRRAGCMGAAASPARSLSAKCQTNFGFTSNAGQFPNVACGATEGWPGLRLLAGVACTQMAGRSLAAITGFCPGAPDATLTVSPVCGRRNERERSAKAAKRIAAANGAGAKLVSPSRARAEQCGHLARSKPVSDQGRGSVRRPERKCPLCEAGHGTNKTGATKATLVAQPKPRRAAPRRSTFHLSCLSARLNHPATRKCESRGNRSGTGDVRRVRAEAKGPP